MALEVVWALVAAVLEEELELAAERVALVVWVVVEWALECLDSHHCSSKF